MSIGTKVKAIIEYELFFPIILAGAAMTMSSLGTLSIYLTWEKNNTRITGITRTVGDLNGDGLEDMALIQSNGGLVPMYASPESDTHYVTAQGMLNLAPQPTDYQSIEDKLNK
jgi:hypothetical protein